MKNEEVKDIVPELLSDITKSFDSKTKESIVLKEKLSKLKNNKANHLDSNEFAQEIGEILSNSFRENISIDRLPDGEMYYNILNRILNPNLKNNYDIINAYAKNVQYNLNKKANINLKAVDAEYNQDRVDGILESALKKDDYSVMINDLCSSVENFSRAIVDELIRKNADFHSKVGLKPVIERKMHGGACSFCKDLARTYDYEEAKRLAKIDPKKNPFTRHRHCKCTVIYNPKNGKNKQIVHSGAKHKALDEKRDRIDVANKIVDNKLSNIARSKAMELGYNPLPDDKVVNVLRKDAQSWIKTLNENEIKAIKKYTYNGKDKDGLRLFEKINGYLENRYDPINENEEEIILRNAYNIEQGLLKNKLKHDIVVYRKEEFTGSLNGKVQKFLSTSVTKRGVLGNEANVAIIIPKSSEGSYVELLSQYKNQREYLINKENVFSLIYKSGNNYIYLLEDDNNEKWSGKILRRIEGKLSR